MISLRISLILFLASITNAVKGQAVVFNFKIPVSFNNFFYIFEKVVLDFIYSSAFDTDKMVMKMSSAFLAEIITGHTVPKINFIDDFQFCK